MRVNEIKINCETEQKLVLECCLTFLVSDLHNRVTDLHNRIDEILKAINRIKKEKIS
jgi:hypothetical protein